MATNVQDCPCVGSMGLHQNNVTMQNNENMSRLGFQFMQFSNRSVIDVFRDLRDRYFGKPELQHSLHLDISQETDDLNDVLESSAVSTINSLPLCCKLMILSLLDTCDVCSVSRLNSHWRDVANDQILWRELLIRDMCEWDSMSDKSHPLIPQFWDQKLLNSVDGVNFTTLLQDQSMVNDISEEQVKNMNGEKICDSWENKVEEGAIYPNIPSHNKERNVKLNKGINFKALYIHSAYQRNQDNSSIATSNIDIPGFIKSLWHGGIEDQGEVIMTGPGMDSPRTSKVFRSLMWGSGFMETKGLLPGNRDGIGSGIQVMFKEKVSFKLIALYSGNNRIRERRFGLERLLNSNVVEAVQNQAQEDEDGEIENAENNIPNEFVLLDSVRSYFVGRSNNFKLVYLVDSTAGLDWGDISCNKLELEAILKGSEVNFNANDDQEQNVQQEPANHIEADEQQAINSATVNTNLPKRPLLVLSCVASPDVNRLPCVQITAMLDLPSITDRPWRVQDVTVSTMDGMEKGLEWLLRQH